MRGTIVNKSIKTKLLRIKKVERQRLVLDNGLRVMRPRGSTDWKVGEAVLLIPDRPNSKVIRP